MPTAITRWDPSSEITSMRNMMDRLFEQSFGRIPAFRGSEELGPSTLGLDVIENGDSFVVKAAVPGIDPKDIEIAVEDDVLTITGEFEHTDQASDENYVRRELRYGSFRRQLRLPPTIDAEHAKADFQHGMLKLTLPKKAEARARSIKITPQGVIDGASASPNGKHEN
jgi:HSP20 family protein